MSKVSHASCWESLLNNNLIPPTHWRINVWNINPCFSYLFIWTLPFPQDGWGIREERNIKSRNKSVPTPSVPETLSTLTLRAVLPAQDSWCSKRWYQLHATIAKKKKKKKRKRKKKSIKQNKNQKHKHRPTRFFLSYSFIRIYIHTQALKNIRNLTLIKYITSSFWNLKKQLIYSFLFIILNLWCFFTGAWGTASLLKFPELSRVFWINSIIL